MVVGLILILAAISATAAVAAPTPPDGRVFERVGPAYTFGQPAVQYAGGFAVPLNDDTVIYGGGPTPAAEVGSGYNEVFVARRGVFGWESSSLYPAGNNGYESYSLLDSTPDLSASTWSLFSAYSFGGEPPGTRLPAAIRYRNAAGAYRTVIEEPQALARFSYAAMSQDGHSVVFTSHEAPIGASNPGHLRRAWRWHPDGSSEMLAADPGSPLADCNVEVAGYTSGDIGSGASEATNAVSADGQTVFLQSATVGSTSETCPEGANGSQVYVNIDGQTTLVSAPEGGLEAGQEPAYFRGATPDGRTAWIETVAPLTPEDNNPGTENLYRWEAAEGAREATLTCLTCGPAGSQRALANHVTLVSPNGSYMYFTERGFPEGPPERLFVEHGGNVEEVPLEGVAIELTGASISSEGNVLLLYDGGRPYRVAVGSTGVEAAPLALNEAGEAAHASITGFYGLIYYGALETAGLAGPAHGAVSEDGQTIAFESFEALAPGAVAELDPETQAPVQNLYRWHDGEVAFVAQAAQSATGATAIGNSIFFLAGRSLAPGESLDAPSIYDARIGGGFPPRPAGPPVCAAEVTCQGPTAPASAALPGSGSAAAPEGASKRRTGLRVVRPTAAQLARFAASGTITLRLRAEGGGALTVLAKARVGGHPATVAKVRRNLAATPSNLRLKLRLSSAARKELGDTGRLRVRLEVGLSGAGRQALSLDLGSGGRK